MIDWTWIAAGADVPLTIGGSAVALYAMLVRCIRLVGLRSVLKTGVATSGRCSKAGRNWSRYRPSR